MNSRSTIFTLIVIVVFLLIVGLVVVSSYYTSKKPEITSISPPAAYPDEVLTIKGSGFEESRGNSDVVVAGIRLTSSHFLEWKNESIKIRVPDGVDSGRVFVITDKGRSNGMLFTNKSHIPVILSGPVEPGYPFIESISPEKGPVGQRVLIEGMNFGRRRGESQVLFRFLAVDKSSASKAESEAAQLQVACSELDFDYALWSDQEIEIFVPDGAVSGSVLVKTDRGASNAVYFEVTNPDGIKRFEQKKGYQIQQDVQISNVRLQDRENGLEVWVPRIFEGYAQHNVEVVLDPEPLWDNYHGVMRYSVQSNEDWFKRVLSATYWLDRYSIYTDINSRSVTGDYDTERELYTRYTGANSFIPSDDPNISSVASSVVGRIRSPYSKAYEIYSYLVRRLEFDPNYEPSTLYAAIEERKAGTREYGLLFTAMARSVGIPARPVAGFIVHDDKIADRHVWAEFYLPDFGWVPVDTALGDGAGMYGIPVDEPFNFYFGNLDNQHISFSRNVIQIPKVNPQAQTRIIENPYSLQTSYEEFPENLQGYSIDWQDIRVIDWW